MDTGVDWITRYDYAGIFALLMLGIVGLPVPDETLLTFVGYLSFKGTLHLGPALMTAFLGSACGISVSYGLGHLLQSRVAPRLGLMKSIAPQHLVAAKEFVRQWGPYALLIGYFVPGFRHMVAVVAGASRLPVGVFMRFAYAGALLWSSSFIGIGYGMGEAWARESATLNHALVTGAVVLSLLMAGGVFILARRTYFVDARAKDKEKAKPTED